MSGIIAFFRASPPKAGAAFDEHRFRRVRWQTFIAMTLAYVTFYVCRLSFTVAKSALVELGITPTELGMIGSTLFFSYAIGKLVNGFIADHANVVRYMSLGLLLSAGMNLMMGMTTNALLLAIFWGINGWAQSMGVGPCAVSLARWYGVKERGTFYGIWSTAHNIGEAVTYMVIAAVIAGFGWQMGYLSTAALGAAGVVLLAATAVWWYFAGRLGNAPANATFAVPLAGAVGGNQLAPVAAGFFLPPARALGTTAFALLVAALLASFGSGNLLGWDALARWDFAGIDVQANLGALLLQPATWCVAVSWLAAAAVLSACRRRPSRILEVLGIVLAAAALVAGICAAAWLASGQHTWMPSAAAIASTAVAVAGLAIASYLEPPAPELWEEGEEAEPSEG